MLNLSLLIPSRGTARIRDWEGDQPLPEFVVGQMRPRGRQFAIEPPFVFPAEGEPAQPAPAMHFWIAATTDGVANARTIGLKLLEVAEAIAHEVDADTAHRREELRRESVTLNGKTAKKPPAKKSGGKGKSGKARS